MSKYFLRIAATMFVLLPAVAAAEPIKLKLAFYSSDRSVLYLAGIKPFVDAVNAASKDLIHVDVYFSGKLGSPGDIPQLLLNGAVDIAFIVPGYAPKVFFDGSVVELPGLFHNAREATLVYTKLATEHIFRSYDKMIVLGAYTSEPESIHSRLPTATVADLKGQRIRTNSATESAAMQRLGAIPVLLAINKTANAISDRTLDGAMIPPAMLFEFGIGRVATNHYMLRTSAALMLLAMNRQSFEQLPVSAQKIIQKYSGAWTANYYVNIIEALNASVTAQLASDPKRKLVVPTSEDEAIAQGVFDRVVKDWTGADVEKAKQLKLLRAELVKVRSVE